MEGQNSSVSNVKCLFLSSVGESLMLFSFTKLSTVNIAKFVVPTEIDCRNLVAEMQLSSDLHTAVEKQTRQQGGCDLWHEIRNG